MFCTNCCRTIVTMHTLRLFWFLRNFEPSQIIQFFSNFVAFGRGPGAGCDCEGGVSLGKIQSEQEETTTNTYAAALDRCSMEI